MAGYSTRALTEKLGIRPGTRVIALGAPAEYPELLAPLPEDVTIQKHLSSPARFVHRFVRTRNELAGEFPRLAAALDDEGSLWISWPKISSGVRTDLTENVVRELGLPLGLVDVKVCAVDQTWSGLKFVRRLSNRSNKR